ncbi:MAG TPA: type II toxin-antitoxin system RelE/ParE family toxin [Methanoculleus sp.]|nr:type II toxin-antitoxin system RelE/ParE family toxin [Methanoculleus sp.]
MKWNHSSVAEEEQKIRMATFRIQIREPAKKWLKKYDIEIQRRFAQKIRKLSEDPEMHGKPLRGSLHGYWELYFERSFRIIYTVDNKEMVVTIEAIKHKDEF